MTPLRQRLLEDMQIRNLSVNTQRSYVEQVSRFARHFSLSPEVLGPEEIRAYQVYLTNEKKLAPGSIVIAGEQTACPPDGNAARDFRSGARADRPRQFVDELRMSFSTFLAISPLASIAWRHASTGRL